MTSALDCPARFSLLAGAVAGRKVGVVGGDERRAFSDGDLIYTAGTAAGPAEGAANRATLVVQAALLAAGSLETRAISRLVGRRALRHRYLTLEAIRAIDLLSAVIPSRVERDARAVYDGPVSASAEESVQRVLRGREAIPEAPEWFGTVKPIRVIRTQLQIGGSRPSDEEIANQARPSPFDELDDEDESERSKILELFSAPAMQNPLSEYLLKLLGAGRSPSGDCGGGGEVRVGGSRLGRVGRDPRRADGPSDLNLEHPGPPIGRLYPEWDYARRRYKRDHCAVAEWDPAQSPDDPEAQRGDDRRLRRELARLGLALERHRRQDHGDVLDLGALIDHVVDKRTGVAPSPRVYETKRRTAQDLGVLVLLDATGSTEESAGGRRIFDEQRRLVDRLTGALDELGNRVACFGFHSWGRSNIRFLRVKGFEDRYDHAARRRLMALRPSGFTRLGAAVRHATWMLTDGSGTTNMLLLVVGDGLPYDDGYEMRYAQEDSRRALIEAVREGVGCACVSVRSTTDDEIVERVWGHVPFRRLDEPSEFGIEVGGLLGGALRQAASTRRRTGKVGAEAMG